MRYTDEVIITAAQAAELTGRPKSTIKRWASEGRIKPVGYVGRLPFYLEADVMRVEELMTRSRPRPSPP